MTRGHHEELGNPGEVGMTSSPSRDAAMGSIPTLLHRALLDPRMNSTHQSLTSPPAPKLACISPRPEPARSQPWLVH